MDLLTPIPKSQFPMNSNSKSQRVGCHQQLNPKTKTCVHRRASAVEKALTRRSPPYDPIRTFVNFAFFIVETYASFASSAVIEKIKNAP
jgi:hypothetical protein